MQVKELGHLVLYVRNLENSARFYRDVLGFTEVTPPFDGGGMRFPAAMFSGGRTHHELLLIEVGEDLPPVSQGRRVGLYHFGLKIGDDDATLREAIAGLERAQVPIVGMADHTVTHSVYLLDPDGNEIELYVDVPGVDWRDPEVLLAPGRPLQI